MRELHGHGTKSEARGSMMVFKGQADNDEGTSSF